MKTMYAVESLSYNPSLFLAIAIPAGTPMRYAKIDAKIPIVNEMAILEFDFFTVGKFVYLSVKRVE